MRTSQGKLALIKFRFDLNMSVQIKFIIHYSLFIIRDIPAVHQLNVLQ
jgi:hypothetical protein